MLHDNLIDLFFSSLQCELLQSKSVSVVMRERTISVRTLQYIWQTLPTKTYLKPILTFVNAMSLKTFTLLTTHQPFISPKIERMKTKFLSALRSLLQAHLLPPVICVLCHRSAELATSILPPSPDLTISNIEWAVGAIVFLRHVVPALTLLNQLPTLSQRRGAVLLGRFFMKLCCKSVFREYSSSSILAEALRELTPTFYNFCQTIDWIGKTKILSLPFLNLSSFDSDFLKHISDLYSFLFENEKELVSFLTERIYTEKSENNEDRICAIEDFTQFLSYLSSLQSSFEKKCTDTELRTSRSILHPTLPVVLPPQMSPLTARDVAIKRSSFLTKSGTCCDLKENSKSSPLPLSLFFQHSKETPQTQSPSDTLGTSNSHTSDRHLTSSQQTPIHHQSYFSPSSSSSSSSPSPSQKITSQTDLDNQTIITSSKKKHRKTSSTSERKEFTRFTKRTRIQSVILAQHSNKKIQKNSSFELKIGLNSSSPIRGSCENSNQKGETEENAEVLSPLSLSSGRSYPDTTEKTKKIRQLNSAGSGKTRIPLTLSPLHDLPSVDSLSLADDSFDKEQNDRITGYLKESPQSDLQKEFPYIQNRESDNRSDHSQYTPELSLHYDSSTPPTFELNLCQSFSPMYSSSPQLPFSTPPHLRTSSQSTVIIQKQFHSHKTNRVNATPPQLPILSLETLCKPFSRLPTPRSTTPQSTTPDFSRNQIQPNSFLSPPPRRSKPNDHENSIQTPNELQMPIKEKSRSKTERVNPKKMKKKTRVILSVR
jgi:hypothetical protein